MKDKIVSRDLTVDVILDQLKHSHFPQVFISNFESLAVYITSDLLSYYLAIEENSFLLIDQMAMAMKKDFKWKNSFNYIYLFLKDCFISRQRSFLFIGKEKHFLNTKDF